MTRITVTVADSHLASTGDVANQLRQKGMAVDSELDALGIITGTVDDSRLSDLNSVAGVKAINEERAFSSPPPDADVQ